MTIATKKATAMAKKDRSGDEDEGEALLEQPKTKSKTDDTSVAEALAKQPEIGIIRIQPLVELDVIPNKITSKPPEPLMLRPEDLYVDRAYQRGHMTRKSRRLIYKIVSEWSWTKYKPPVVTRDGKGRYLVIDGQHTAVAAATHPDIASIPAMFVPLESVEEQAKSFIGHNMDRVNVPTLDVYHARIIAGDEDVIECQRILNENNITVVRSIAGSNHEWRHNETMATAIIIRLLQRHGLPKFTQIVEFIAQCGYTQIRAAHWQFAAALLAPAGNQLYSPNMMIRVIKESTNEGDALHEARRISSDRKLPIWAGLLLYYQNRYKKFYKIS